MRGRFLAHERACFAIEMTGAEVVRGAARSIGRKIRVDPLSPMNQGSGLTGQRTRAMVGAGIDRARDFIFPEEYSPVARIEAKLAEDEGKDRDDVARVRRLHTLRDEQRKTYDVTACVSGARV